MKISQSAYKKYLQCPRMYKLHYLDRLRPTGIGSQLVFGVAMDEALNALLLKTGDPLKVFKDNFKFEDMGDVQWNPGDLDERLFTPEQLEKISHYSMEQRTWASMRVKGRMLIEKYLEDIYPLITKVHSVQRDLSGRKGVIDAIVDIKGHGKVLLDHKTSKNPYKPDAIENDIQLALYCKDQGIDKAGFAVLVKTMKPNKVCIKCGAACYSSHKSCPQEVNAVRCHGKFEYAPSASVQLIIDDAPKALMKVVDESFNDVEKSIKDENFPMNLSQCKSYFGKVCPYYDFCRHGKKNMLEYIPETKEKK